MCGKCPPVAIISALLLELALQNERQTRTRRILSCSPFRSWMSSGRLEPTRRAPRRKTADLYFFVEGAAGRPVHGPRAVCVPYTGCALYRPIIKRIRVRFNVIICVRQSR